MRRSDREVTDLKEIEDIIKQCRVCHVAMVDDGKPYVIPLSFGYELKEKQLTLFFHSAQEGKKLDILRKNNRVCFDMTCEGEVMYAQPPCNSGCYFSSVIGMGEVEFIEETEEKCKALSLLMKHQADKEVKFSKEQADSVCVYKICVKEFTGKKKPAPKAE